MIFFERVRTGNSTTVFFLGGLGACFPRKLKTGSKNVFFTLSGKTDVQGDASFQLASTCISISPGLACTWVDLRSFCSRSSLHASQRKFFIICPPYTSQSKSCCLLPVLKGSACSSIEMVFMTTCKHALASKLTSPFGVPIQVCMQVQLAIWPAINTPARTQIHPSPSRDQHLSCQL